ncbi:MAG: hypothetical protein AAB573_01810 [Patescibacteria group bacterium]
MVSILESADILAGLLVKRRHESPISKLRTKLEVRLYKSTPEERTMSNNEYKNLSTRARLLFERVPPAARPAIRKRIGEATGHYPELDMMVHGLDRYDLTPRYAHLNMRSPVRRIVTLKREDGKLRAESRKL